MRALFSLKMTALLWLTLVIFLAGLFFGENPFVGFGLIGIGVILAVVDMYNKSKHK